MSLPIAMQLVAAHARAEQLESELARLEPLRTVLRSWDWEGIAKDGVDPIAFDRWFEQVIDAFAAVERAEKELSK